MLGYSVYSNLRHTPKKHIMSLNVSPKIVSMYPNIYGYIFHHHQQSPTWVVRCWIATSLEDRHGPALLCQHQRHRQTCGACAHHHGLRSGGPEPFGENEHMVKGWGPPMWCERWCINHESPWKLVREISTINHRNQPLINQLNAILGAPSCTD